jgi:Flp pilus assembly protein TadB
VLSWLNENIEKNKTKRNKTMKKIERKRAGAHRRGTTFVLVFALFVLSYFIAMIWFHSMNRFRPATRLVLWILIQHYYLLLNCVPDILILLPSQAP